MSYVPEEGLLEKGDEVIIFLNEDGYSWGPQGVLKIEGDNVFVGHDKEKRNKDEFIKELKSKSKN